MAYVTLDVAVSNIDAVLSIFDFLKFYKSTTGAAGPYIELTDATSLVPLNANTTTYSFVDKAGDPGDFYKTSYYSSAKGIESSLSEPFQGAGDSALELISVQELKTEYYNGLDMSGPDGVDFPDSFYEFYIKSAVSYVENVLDIPLRLTTVVNEKHDFYAADQREYLWTQVYKFPAISVQQMRLQMPGSAPIVFPPDWIDFNTTTGVIEVTPTNSYSFDYNLAPIPTGYMGGYSSYSSRKRIPSAIRVDYTAGFAPGTLPADLKELVGTIGSFGGLAVAGDLIGGPGIASSSLSLDGVSSSVATTSSAENSGYSGRTKLYERTLAERIPVLRRKYKGVPMAII